MEQEFSTTLNDAHGIAHKYVTYSFPASEGADLLFTIGEIVGGPLGQVIQALLTLENADAANTDLGEMIERVPRMIAAKGGATFLRKILVRTKRDDGNGNYLNCGKQTVFDSVYASNIFEMFRAVAWVLECNFAPFSTGGTPSWKVLWETLAEYLPIERATNMSETQDTAPS